MRRGVREGVRVGVREKVREKVREWVMSYEGGSVSRIWERGLNRFNGFARINFVFNFEDHTHLKPDIAFLGTRIKLI